MPHLLTLAGILLLFGLTIFVHELGHFLAARRLGLKAEVFSIGFGPALWQRRIRGVLYKIGALPFGGYVSLPQLDPTGGAFETRPPDSEPLPRASPGRRILVSAAGAAGNLLFAYLLAWVVFWAGKPSAPHERRCVVGYVAEDSAAWRAGLRIGDEILAVGEQPVGNWQDLLTRLSLQGDQAVLLSVRRNGEDPRLITLPTERSEMGLRFLEGVEWETLSRVGRVVPGGGADRAGIQAGDLILAFDGQPVYSFVHLTHLVEAAGTREVEMRIKRGNRILEIPVRPEFNESSRRHMIGVEFLPRAVDADLLTHPTPLTQIREHAKAIGVVLRALVTPRTAGHAAQAVGGPVAIFRGYWSMIESGLIMTLWFTAFLNVNLAILNLLPIPVLDGGHIVFSAIEGVFRRPVRPGIVVWAYRVSATLLIGIIVLLTVRDSNRWISPLFRRPAAEEPADGSKPAP